MAVTIAAINTALQRIRPTLRVDSKDKLPEVLRELELYTRELSTKLDVTDKAVADVYSTLEAVVADYTTLVAEAIGADADATFSKGFSIDTPVAGDSLTVVIVEERARLTKANVVISASGSETLQWTLNWSTDRSDANPTKAVEAGTLTSSTTGGSRVIVFDNTDIPADSWVWFEVVTAGTVDEVGGTFYFETI